MKKGEGKLLSNHKMTRNGQNKMKTYQDDTINPDILNKESKQSLVLNN